MARTAKHGLSKHATKGFRLGIGRKANGKARTFWLGHIPSIAEHHADTLRGHFTNMQAQGRNVWTDADVTTVQWYLAQYKSMIAGFKQRQQFDVRANDERRAEVEAQLAHLSAKGESLDRLFGNTGLPSVAAPVETPAAATTPKLHAMIDTYFKWFSAKGDRSPSTKGRLSEVVESLKRAHADIEMYQIDRLWIDQATQYWKNRPKHRQTGKPLSTYTCKTHIQAMSQFFNWASDNDETTRFSEPKKMQKLFRYRPAAIEEIQQLEMGEIKTLYRAASDAQRLYLLMGVLCGQTQSELAVTRADEFNLADSMWKHRRHKTGVVGTHWLCPELVKLIRERIKTSGRREDGLAFATREGMPLVTHREGEKVSDAVRQAWGDLLTKAKLKRRPSFKLCRKFAAQWFSDHHGEEVAQIALQHKPTSVLRRHYAPRQNFDPLHEAQKAMYAAFQAAGVFDDADKK